MLDRLLDTFTGQNVFALLEKKGVTKFKAVWHLNNTCRVDVLNTLEAD